MCIRDRQDAITTSVGSAGTNTFKVTYTPEDTDNYNTVKDVEVTLTVKEKDTQKPTTDDNKKPSATDTDKKPESTDTQTTANSPKTGDSTNMTTWLALMFVSLGLLAGVFTVRKSRRSR